MFVLLMDWPDSVTKSVSLPPFTNQCDHRFHAPPGPLPLTKVSSTSASSMGGSGRIFCEYHCTCTQLKPLTKRAQLRDPKKETPTLHAHAIGDKTSLQAGRGCLHASSPGHSTSDASDSDTRTCAFAILSSCSHWTQRLHLCDSVLVS